MHALIIVVAAVVILGLSRMIQRRWLRDDAASQDRYRRLLWRWSLRAALISFVLAVLLVIWLKVLV